MIGKIISKSAHSEEAAVLKAVLKKDAGNGNGDGGTVPVFKSLLNGLQGDNISAGNEKSMAEGMLSDEEMESLANEVKNSEAVNAKAENIFSILSEGDPKNEEVITQFRQLLKQVKQEGRGAAEQSPQAGGAAEQAAALKHPGGAGEAAGGSEGKMRSAQLNTDLRELLSRHLSDEEAGRLVKAAASGQIDSVTGKIARVLPEGNLKEEDIKVQLRQLLKQVKQEGQGKTDSLTDKIARLLSEGNMKDEEVKIQLRKLLNQLQQKGQGPAVHSSKTEGASEQAQAEGKNMVEGEAPGRSAKHKTDRLFRSSSDDKERAVRDQSRASHSEKVPEGRSSQDRLEKTIAGNRGRNSEQSVEIGRNGRLEISDQQDQQKKITDDFFLKNPSAGVSEKGLEMKGAQLRKSLQKEDRNPVKGRSGRSGRVEGERRLLVGRSSPSADANRNNVASAGISGTGGSTDSISPSTDEQELMWKEYSSESAEIKDEKETGQPMVAPSSLRLGQIPIANAALRTKVLPALTQNALAAAAEARKTPEQWQKHNFVLDDGKKMQLSVREVQGVLQVKMGSVNLDLSKLLQQHLQQIREHLKQELGSEIDLQLDHPEQEGPASHFSGHPPGRNGRDESPLGSGGVEPTRTDDTGKAKLKAVRNFGYNEMEWIA